MHNFRGSFCAVRQENALRDRFRTVSFLGGMENRDFSAFYSRPKDWYTHANERERPEQNRGLRSPVNKANKHRRYTMKIEKSAMAGTLESSDAQVTVEPASGLELNIQSSVLNQYGRQIKATVLETLDRLDVKDARVTIVDKGALDCTLKARVECAVFRSCGASEANIPWGGAVK